MSSSGTFVPDSIPKFSKLYFVGYHLYFQKGVVMKCFVFLVKYVLFTGFDTA